MNPDPWYCQCRYEAETPTGKKIGTSWIPEPLAIKDKRIYFGQETDSPDLLWTITEVFSRERRSEIRRRADEHRHWREHAGIPGVFRGSGRKKHRRG